LTEDTVTAAPSHNTTAMGEQTDAAKRAAARKAKILARGNAGLDRLAQTARGDEASKLYQHGETSKSPYTGQR
jgi:hypothetical protein